MPIVFLFSAMVSGIALVMLHLHGACTRARDRGIDMPCLDTIARYLFYTFIIDFSLEMLDLLHRIYEADESFRALDFMVHTRLWVSHIAHPDRPRHAGAAAAPGLGAARAVQRAPRRRRLYAVSGVLALIGIFAMRWNVVIGGQLFSKSFLGYTTYKMAFATREGLLPALVLLVLPFVILAGLVRLLPPWADMQRGDTPAGVQADAGH